MDSATSIPGPLAGLKVIDFGQYVAGPLTAVLLADQGADVIHVDPPGGPRLTGPADAFFNRGKRRITLDLKQGGDLAAARRLASQADVVIENFRPGTLARLGLDLAEIRAGNPALITCSLPGAMLAEGGLSYLGFGVQAPTPSWGQMIAQGQQQLTFAPWQVIIPCIVFALTVFALYTLGDWLRARLDVRGTASD